MLIVHKFCIDVDNEVDDVELTIVMEVGMRTWKLNWWWWRLNWTFAVSRVGTVSECRVARWRNTKPWSKGVLLKSMNIETGRRVSKKIFWILKGHTNRKMSGCLNQAKMLSFKRKWTYFISCFNIHCFWVVRRSLHTFFKSVNKPDL